MIKSILFSYTYTVQSLYTSWNSLRIKPTTHEQKHNFHYESRSLTRIPLKKMDVFQYDRFLGSFWVHFAHFQGRSVSMLGWRSQTSTFDEAAATELDRRLQVRCVDQNDLDGYRWMCLKVVDGQNLIDEYVFIIIYEIYIIYIYMNAYEFTSRIWTTWILTI